MPKKIILTFASLFLLWQSIKLAGNLQYLESSSWAITVLVAWLFNLFVTGIFAFAGFAYPTQRLLPRSYYDIHRPINLLWWYKLLKVGWFRRALLATLWRSGKQSKRYFNGRRDGIPTLKLESMKSEFGHLIPFVILTGYSLYLLSRQTYGLAFMVMLINLVGNLYPILLQRFHRERLRRLEVSHDHRLGGATSP